MHPILATYLPIDYPFSIPLLDCGRAIRSVAHTRKHTHTDPRSNVLPASGGVFSRPMHHTHTHVWRNLWGNHARGAFDRKYLVRGLFAHPAGARTHTQSSRPSRNTPLPWVTQERGHLFLCVGVCLYMPFWSFFISRGIPALFQINPTLHISSPGAGGDGRFFSRQD